MEQIDKGATTVASANTTSIIGTPVPRVEVYERFSSSAVYTADVIFPGNAAIAGQSRRGA